MPHLPTRLEFPEGLRPRVTDFRTPFQSTPRGQLAARILSTQLADDTSGVVESILTASNWRCDPAYDLVKEALHVAADAFAAGGEPDPAHLGYRVKLAVLLAALQQEIKCEIDFEVETTVERGRLFEAVPTAITVTAGGIQFDADDLCALDLRVLLDVCEHWIEDNWDVINADVISSRDDALYEEHVNRGL